MGRGTLGGGPGGMPMEHSGQRTARIWGSNRLGMLRREYQMNTSAGMRSPLRRRTGATSARILVLITLLAALLPGLASTPAPASAASSYTITDLGTLPDNTSSFANSINNAGHVTGNSFAGITSH